MDRPGEMASCRNWSYAATVHFQRDAVTCRARDECRHDGIERAIAGNPRRNGVSGARVASEVRASLMTLASQISWVLAQCMAGEMLQPCPDVITVRHSGAALTDEILRWWWQPAKIVKILAAYGTIPPAGNEGRGGNGDRKR